MEAEAEMAELLGVDEGASVNHRKVMLVAGDVPYVNALSLSPLDRMPEGVQQDLMQADVPIGKILRNYGMETRRDFETIQLEDGQKLFGCETILSRTYRIIYHNKTLMWIKESFPVDGRWNL
jgi:chorismate-pyruvate lyase